MKFLLSLYLLFNLNAPNWNYNYKQAFEKAKTENKLVLINFSGSDWCGPCIRLHKDVFSTETFNKISSEYLVLVNADFPRAKKNQLSADQQKLNDAIADKYNSKGSFPLTVLTDSNGVVIKEWDGYQGNVDEFLEDLKTTIQNITIK